MKIKKLLFLEFLIFFVIPNDFQKPLRVALITYLFIITYYLLYAGNKTWFWIVTIAYLISAVSVAFGGYSSALVNSSMILPVVVYYSLGSSVNLIDRKKVNILCLCSIVSLSVQMLMYSSDDGRPKLGYEINYSGAYLFLLFISGLVFKRLVLIIFSIFLSAFILSRLFFLAIITTFVSFIVKRQIFPVVKKNLILVVVFVYSAFFYMNYFFVENAEIKVGYSTGVERLSEIADSSNYLRFTTNISVLNEIKDNWYKFISSSYNILDLTQSNFLDQFNIMPHNELLYSVAQNGLLITAIYFFICLTAFKRVLSIYNIYIFIPVVVYGLILWVRFLFVPSLEMLYIMLLMIYCTYEKSIYCSK